MAKQRPNSRMKRVKAMLEIAAGAYGDRKLDLGVALDISIRSSDEEDNIFPPLRLGVHGELMGGMKAPIEVGKRRVDVSHVNPSVIATMAYRGKGFYKEPAAVAGAGVLPLLGPHRLRRFGRVGNPLGAGHRPEQDTVVRVHPGPRESTTPPPTPSPTSCRCTVCRSGRLSVGAARSTSARILPRPKRIESIKARRVDAVFDEGLPTKWLEAALKNGYEVLHLDEEVIRGMEALGFKRAVIPKRRYPGLKEDVRTVDFSGWPIITHKWLSKDMAYSLCEAIYRRRRDIPVDAPRLNIREVCRDTDAGPLGIPLHAGAKQFYKDKGFL